MAFIANDIGEVAEGTVNDYLDGNGLECDAVVSLPDGRYDLIQVKLGQTDETVQDGANKLLSLRDKLDFDKMRKPAFMMVLTGNGRYAYRREDGVYVVPIGCLKP